MIPTTLLALGIPTISEIIVFVACGAGGFILGSLGAAALYIWKISSRWSEMRKDVENLKGDQDKIDRIPILVEKMDQLIERIDKLTENHEEFRKAYIDSETCKDRCGEIKRRLNKLEESA